MSMVVDFENHFAPPHHQVAGRATNLSHNLASKTHQPEDKEDTNAVSERTRVIAFFCGTSAVQRSTSALLSAPLHFNHIHPAKSTPNNLAGPPTTSARCSPPVSACTHSRSQSEPNSAITLVLGDKPSPSPILSSHLLHILTQLTDSHLKANTHRQWHNQFCST